MTDKRERLDYIRKKINEALAQVEGVSFTPIGTIQYSDKDFHFTIKGYFSETAVANEDVGKVEFRLYAKRYGLSEDDYGKEVSIGGNTYTLCGIHTRNRKYPIIAKRTDGKNFKFSEKDVLYQLNLQNRSVA